MKAKQNKVLSFFLVMIMLVPVMPMGTVKAFALTSGDFEYAVLSEEEKTCAITQYNGSAYELTIPSQLNGYKVTSIGREAFCDCTSLGSVIIPDSVTSIKRYAFYYCESLIKIEIPDSVTNIGDHAFEQTPYYRSESYWENGVLYIGNHLIEAKVSLSGDYTVKPGTKTIADIAFSCCSSLTSVIIPESVTSIGEYAFDNCPLLEIYGYSDSYAKAYAENNSIKFCLMGDIDGNGAYETNDYAMLVARVKCQFINTSAPGEAGDINLDGAVDGFDAIQLDLYLNGVTDIYGKKIA